MSRTTINKIISGGQTGVDRGALDACLSLGLPCGGWCPRGRRAEDGRIAAKYPLQETSSPAYNERTRRNIQDSDGTLIITYEKVLRGGTRLTASYAEIIHRPLFFYYPPALFVDVQFNQLIHFLIRHSVRRLNVAGPRESQWQQAYSVSYQLIFQLISSLR